MTNVVLFGLGKVADVVMYYMQNESDFNVVAFTCDREFVDRDEYEGLPVVPFDEVQASYPPDRFSMFVALGYQQMNSLRADRVAQVREKGYQTPSYVHPDAGLPKNARIGGNCFIMNHVCVQPHVSIGDNVFVWSGALIGHHSSVGDNCWITSNASIAGGVTVKENCFVAVNATVGNDVSIGSRCFLGANTLITKDMQDNQVAIEKSTEVHRLTSDQFLRISRFH